ncbi:polyketide synthase [Truncatella angustata]|uniref:Polyketide synthase n=1 Tax=Truncatella angustata TaxID=152316 RepID=A0A9P8UBN4_9PEZI|nr:polyketide synthase [Truncatella angustata]KAH6643321.1 polyketide synthase [Truncatella angustata]
MHSNPSERNQSGVREYSGDEDFANSRLCLHQSLELVTESHRDKTAVICGEKALTFGELNVLANRYARVLSGRGAKNGDLIGVALDRSVDLVAVLLAVMKTGAAYVPIDPAFPAERINQMMDDACPKLVIADYNALEALASWKNVCLNVDDVLDTTESDIDGNNLDTFVQNEDLAYVMYTSGTTGRPKGVVVSHGNVSNLLLSMRKEPGCSETDRLLAITTVSFDMAVLELFLPLLCGATVVIAQRHEVRDPAALVTLMERHEITIMQGTPAIWQMLLDSGWLGQPRLEKIFCGGEALSRRLADRLLACGDMMWNMYGPTEATVYASIWRVCEDHEVIIGSPINNGHLYVLDENQLPVSPGSPGELYIGGAGVARGYRNKEELNRSRFLKNPFHNGQMYRTGDLARFVAPGELSMMGRIDGQVKIRGYRIELGDIEAAINEHEQVSGSVLVCRDDRLVAYCLRETTALSNGGEARAAIDQILRPWLASRLPSYMVPSFFVEMEAFPVTINGKIDRKALPDPVATSQTTANINPTMDIQGQIFTIWSRVLGHSHISGEDSFFEVGGDSLRLVRVQKELEKLLGRPISLTKLFEHFTIKTLAAHLTSSPDLAGPELVTRQRGVSDTDIAIVSMACRLPGGINTPEEFWELLERGGDAIIDVPKDRWNVGAWNNTGADSQRGLNCYRGGFIPSVNSFDISFFGISPKEARRLDPSQYMMLETCWEGFERAGYTMEKLRGSQTGVFIGTSNILAHQSLNPTAIKDLSDLDGYTVTGSAAGTMSGRISYQLGLEGPSMTIDTACSSSLVTTHLACNALRQGECDVAVSGGVSLMLNSGLHVEFSRLKGMSPDGRCRSFSADAEGTGWSEGSAVVVLKRLSDAQRDGDSIHAVIRGTAVNHDGRSASLTTPSGPAQQRLIDKSLNAARLNPDDIDYVEAHGTATKLGDPIEATALAEVFGPTRQGSTPLLIGSAKSNIGHTQAAAGLVGLLKVTLALRHGMLPQTLHVAEPTPAVDWQSANMSPVLSKVPWLSQGSRLRRAGVSAFGIGGTNAHVIVEESPRQILVANNENTSVRRRFIMPFLLSGDNNAVLRQQAENLHRYVKSTIGQDDLGNIAYSLATTRTHFRKRSVLMAENKVELLEKLDSIVNSNSFALPTDSAAEAPRIAMLFTGQGSQWPGMGKDLCEIYPIFRKTINEIACEFTDLEPPLLDVMWAEPGTAAAALLDRTDYTQPALFALEVGLWRLWQDWGVKPDFVLGHSLGEFVAAHVAGILDLSDACRLVAARGRLMQAQTSDSMMVSLGVSSAEIAAAVEQLGYSNAVNIAAYNTPTQTVISGDTGAVKNITSYFTEQGCKSRTLVVGHAFHSRQMDGILEDLRVVAETIRYNSPKLAIISSLDGSLAEPGRLEHASYWVKQTRESVRFSDGIKTLARHGVNVFLEIGPQPVLCGMGVACLADDEKSQSLGWLPSLTPGKTSTSILQRSVIDLHIRHVPVKWSAYFGPFGCQRIELPTYAFRRDYHIPFDIKQSMISGDASGVSNNISYTTRSGQGGFEFEVVWHPVKANDIHISRTWGILLPAGNTIWAKRVAISLLGAGIRLIEIEDLKHTENLDGVMCLWNSNTDVMSQSQDLSATALTQLQAAIQAQSKIPLVWVTCNAVGTGTGPGDQAMKLAAAPLWGLMRTARNEHPELNLRLVDLDEETSSYTASALMLMTEPECAVRQGQVLVPRMQHVAPVAKPSPKKRLIRPDGAVLITGGIGNLGARVARWLVTSHDIRDVVLTSRHGMEASGADALVADLSKIGARVTVIASNIAEPENLKSVMAMFTENRPLRGVVHAAGVVDSGVLSAMTPERCATTFAPKVYGAWLLHQFTQNMDLDIFMMFSSISGVMGMPGLANYAAANTFLDALAHLRRAQHLPATSVAYGTWTGEGMASRLSHITQSHLIHFGLDPLTPEEGLRLFDQAVVSDRALTIAAALDLERLRGYLDEQGGIPPLLCRLLTQEITTPSRGWELSKMLSETGPSQHSGIMLSMIRGVVAKALGFAQPSDVAVDRSLQDIGIDSLTAVQVRNHLATLTGLTLSVNIAFLHPNLKSLSQFLLSQLQDTDTSSTTTASSRATSATTIFETPLLNVMMMLKGCLDSTFTFDNVTQNPHISITRPRSVFLTGATGFVGASVLEGLLKQGITTYCFVRADRADKARQRVVTTLEDYGLWQPHFAALINVTIGDMGQPLLGLTEEAFDDLAERVDAICHSGALVDWMRPLEDYVGPNIISTHEILRLASRGCAKTVHLVSTISTLPKHMGLDLNEEDQEYGYGTSKYIAEKMVAAARWRGARASIYRLPYVTASSTTGHFRLDRGDFLHNLIVGSLEIGVFPSVDADIAAVLPVDYLSKTIVAVMTQDLHYIGRDYDFLNREAPTCNEFFKMIGAVHGGNDVLPFSKWKQRALDYAMTHPTSPLARIAAVLDNYTDKTAAGMFKGSSVGEHVFGGHDYPAPSIDERFISTYLSCIDRKSNTTVRNSP